MKVFSDTKKGRRPSNEDEGIIILNLHKEHPELQPINMYCIFDGHGGNMISKFLKENFSDYFMIKSPFIPEINEIKEFQRYVVTVFNHIQLKICNVYKNLGEHCGSTAVVVFHYMHKKKEYLHVANIGDSRGIFCNHQNLANPMTRDHKPNAPEEKKRIESIISLHPDEKVSIELDDEDYRIKGLSLSRAFGDMDAMPYVTHEPELFHHQVSDMKFIIIACDGVWDVMDNQRAVDFVLNFLEKNSDKNEKKNIFFSKDRNKKNIAHLLAQKAIELESTDNITVTIVIF